MHPTDWLFFHWSVLLYTCIIHEGQFSFAYWQFCGLTISRGTRVFLKSVYIYIYIHTYRLIQSVCNHTTDWQNQTRCLAFVYHKLIKTSENSNETFVGKKGWIYSKIKNKTVDVFLRENRPIGLINQRTKLFSTSKSEKRNGLMLLH